MPRVAFDALPDHGRLWVFPMSRALGATVYGTAGSDEKVALALENGCHEVINYRREEFAPRIRELTGGRGVDVVYDGVGKATFEASLDCLRRRGLMVSFGNASGPVSIPNLGILSSKSRRAEKGEDPVKEHLLVTRYDPVRVERGEMLAVDDVQEILSIPLLGVIPESQAVLRASNIGQPVILDEESSPAQAYEDAVGRFLGDTIEHRFVKPVRRGFFARLMGRPA